jgi:hypothetical protein
LKISKNKDLLWDLSNLVVREIHLGDWYTIPPVLAIERKLIESEKLWRKLFGFLSDEVEGSTLQSPFDGVGERLLLYHFSNFSLKFKILKI